MTRPDIQFEDIPEWPVVHIGLHPDLTTGEPLLTIGGARVTVPAGHDPRRYAIQAVSRRAKVLGRPIRAIAREGPNEWPLIIHPDGAITDPNAVPPPRRGRRTGHPPGWRMPTGLGLGIAGLVLLVGLAASVFVVGPAAQRSIAAPPPASSSSDHTSPTSRPSMRRHRSAPPSAHAPAISTHPQPAASSSAPATTTSRPPTITFAPPATPATPSTRAAPPSPPRSTPGAAVPHTREQPAPRRRPAPTTTSTRTVTPSPSTEQTTPSTTQAPTPHGPAIRGPVHIGDYCLAEFIGVAIAERCAGNTAEQTWTFHDGQLQQADGCLTVSDQRAILATCTGDDSQHWGRTTAGQLHNVGTNTCLIPASTDSNTATVSAVTCST